MRIEVIMAGEKRHRSLSTSTNSPDDRSVSPHSTSRSPVRSPPSPPHSKHHDDPVQRSFSKRRTNLSVDVCKDFTKGRCKRSPLECKYAHPSPTVAVEENKVTVCFDSLRERCVRGISCRYYHPSPRILVLLQEAAGIQPTIAPLGYQVDAIRSANLFFGPPGLHHPLPVLTPPSSVKTTNKASIEVCRDYVRGRCSREADECRYAHHAPTAGQGDYVTVCADYLRGKCERDSCRYFHAPEHLRSRIKDVPVEPAATFNSVGYNLGIDAAYVFRPSAYDQQSVKRMRTIDNADEYPSRGLASQQYGVPIFQVPAIRGTQLVPPPVLQSSEAADEDRVPVCRDYQKNKCSRDSSCKYAHPEPQTQVVDNYVTICRDFQRGKCKRESCRFYHQSKIYDSRRNGHAVKSR